MNTLGDIFSLVDDPSLINLVVDLFSWMRRLASIARVAPISPNVKFCLFISRYIEWDFERTRIQLNENRCRFVQLLRGCKMWMLIKLMCQPVFEL